MSKLILIRGLPGSGKTTFAHKIVNKTLDNVVHVEIDDYWLRPDGYYDFNAALLDAAHAWCQHRARIGLLQAMTAGAGTVIVSNTFATWREIEPYIRLAREFKSEVEVITLNTMYGSIRSVLEATMTKTRVRFESHDTILANISMV